jgi:hypothetical protein
MTVIPATVTAFFSAASGFHRFVSVPTLPPASPPPTGETTAIGGGKKAIAGPEMDAPNKTTAFHQGAKKDGTKKRRAGGEDLTEPKQVD